MTTPFERLAHAIPVVIVDDHPVVRAGLAEALSEEPSIIVAGVAGDVPAALALISQRLPRVALIDLTLGNQSGLDLIAKLRARAPQVRILVFSAHDERAYIERVLRAGAHGYLAKTHPHGDLVAAIEAVAAGNMWVSHVAAEHILRGLDRSKVRDATAHAFHELSDREVHIVQLIARGLSTREIADALGVAYKTVEAHYAHIKLKADLRTGRDLIRMAVLWTQSRPLQDR